MAYDMNYSMSDMTSIEGSQRTPPSGVKQPHKVSDTL